MLYVFNEIRIYSGWYVCFYALEFDLHLVYIIDKIFISILSMFVRNSLALL